jgi:membrane associated rhomboid family serine protease
MFLPLSVDVPMNRRPIANWALIAVTTCISVIGWYNLDLFLYLAGYDSPRSGLGVWADKPEFVAAGWELPIVAVTSTFLHGGIIHLAGNLFFLWIFGNAVNYKLGHLGFLGLYLAGALFGGLAQYWAVPGVGAIGASGAIMCVMGAFLVFFPRNDVEVYVDLGRYYYWGEPFYVPAWVPMLTWVGFDVLYLRLGAEGIGFFAHLAGFATGFAVALVLAASRLVEPTPYEQTLLQVLGLRQTPERDVFGRERRAARPRQS